MAVRREFAYFGFLSDVILADQRRLAHGLCRRTVWAQVLVLPLCDLGEWVCIYQKGIGPMFTNYL